MDDSMLRTRVAARKPIATNGISTSSRPLEGLLSKSGRGAAAEANSAKSPATRINRQQYVYIGGFISILLLVIYFRFDTSMKQNALAGVDNTASHGEDAVGVPLLIDATNQNRSFVCITGQLGRLELDNKIITMLAPLRNAGYEPDVALILDESSTYSTSRRAARPPSFQNYSQAVEYLGKLQFNVITSSPYRQGRNPLVRDDYLAQLDNGGTPVRRRQRVENHARVWESLNQCYMAMTSNFQRAQDYRVVVRVREDAGIFQPLDVAKVLNAAEMAAPSIISDECQSYGECGISIAHEYGRGRRTNPICTRNK